MKYYKSKGLIAKSSPRGVKHQFLMFRFLKNHFSDWLNDLQGILIIFQTIPLLRKVPSEGKIEALVFRLQYLQKWYPGYICDNDLCFYQYVFEKLARWLQRLCTTPKHKAGLLLDIKKGIDLCAISLLFKSFASAHL